ncbi:hypothetical protein AVEN_33002-1 [Araneus ventricosus]|uniref:Uncharacterized protein n=1 Tax=Araneus ventricosus TaxID=182803 RepID=A0A4Y2MWM5_ARAVE|nr:hypothetical protein AVEN_33002-1 [Araneus ventricosus]
MFRCCRSKLRRIVTSFDAVIQEDTPFHLRKVNSASGRWRSRVSLLIHGGLLATTGNKFMVVERITPSFSMHILLCFSAVGRASWRIVTSFHSVVYQNAPIQNLRE